ncbi:MAG: hypothetical protein WC479_10625 [Candidatus Izemoplasmatales bacterium]
MAFPTTGILDNFDRSDTHPMTGWTDYANGLDANGATAQASVAATNVSYWNISYGANAEGYITMTTKGTSSTQLFLLDTSFNGYMLDADPSGGYTVYRYDAGTPTSIDSGVHSWANGDSIGIYVTTDGTVYSYYKTGAGAWTLLDTTADGTHTAKNYFPGLTLYDTTARVDNFGGGTYVPPVEVVTSIVYPDTTQVFFL